MSYYELTIDDLGPDVVVISILSDDPSPGDIVHLGDALKSHLDQGRRRFVFDCRDVQHFSSAFIGTVVTTLQAARDEKTVAIVGTRQHADILEICRLQNRLPVLGDLPEALSAVRG